MVFRTVYELDASVNKTIVGFFILKKLKSGEYVYILVYIGSNAKVPVSVPYWHNSSQLSVPQL